MISENASSAARCVREAQQGVAEACTLLLSPAPEMLDRAGPPLADAVRSLKELEGSLTAGQRDGSFDALRPSLDLLRKDAKRCNVLLEAAAAFYTGWARMLYAALGGYTRTGDPAPPETPGNISLQA